MANLQYAISAYDRDKGNFAELPLINMVVEEVPSEPNPTLQSRPGLDEEGTVMGDGPVEALYQIDGVLDGSLFGISARGLYKNSTSLGAVDGNGPARLAGYATYVFATAGNTLYGYDGTLFAEVATPEDFEVLDLCVGSSRLIVIKKDTGQFFWTNVLTETIDDLSFATSENSPDKLKAVLFIGDTLHLFGSETVEFWPASSVNPDLPFQPLVGRTYQVGIRDTGCATIINGTFAWITNRNQIALTDPNQIISNAGIDEKLASSSSASLWTFRLDGVEYLVVTLDTETWAFSSSTGTWSLFESYGEDNFVPQCAVGNVFGSSVDGKILEWGSDYTDLGGILERRFRAGMAIDSGSVFLDNILLRSNPGRTPYATGDYATPVVELRTSKDGGENWSNWKAISLGQQGELRKMLRWRSLGAFGSPGLLVEFRVTDPVPFRVSNVLANEDYPGV
jgi:hypothetical protein